MSRKRWRVRLSAAAEADFANILLWTQQRYGAGQAVAYQNTMTEALEALATGPSVAGVTARTDIGTGLYTLHVARGRRRGRHFILFRVSSDLERPALDVLRLLHDGMDLVRHAQEAAPARD